MALNPSLIVRIERKPGAFGDTMNEIRSWLDSRHIHPASFAPVSDSGVGFEISFNDEDEARLFRARFSRRNPAPHRLLTRSSLPFCWDAARLGYWLRRRYGRRTLGESG